VGLLGRLVRLELGLLVGAAVVGFAVGASVGNLVRWAIVGAVGRPVDVPVLPFSIDAVGLGEGGFTFLARLLPSTLILASRACMSLASTGMCLGSFASPMSLARLKSCAPPWPAISFQGPCRRATPQGEWRTVSARPALSGSAPRVSELSSAAASGSASPVSRAIVATMSTCPTSASEVLPGVRTRWPAHDEKHAVPALEYVALESAQRPVKRPRARPCQPCASRCCFALAGALAGPTAAAGACCRAPICPSLAHARARSRTAASLSRPPRYSLETDSADIATLVADRLRVNKLALKVPAWVALADARLNKVPRHLRWPPSFAECAATLAFGDELLVLPDDKYKWRTPGGRDSAAVYLLPRAETALLQELL
jgi:hypothetical protein